ncbi:uncharacterized protein LOC131633372 isoform X2 [Vicia villosa]|uniref:uncharacterized protein LOC131633372 isoform X2 n=1 Tax=Vicia villosa TaxID=3911 RepID=UPI00273B808C|nr:uncharacterized protein LOC131633372 isoform X2 [Vicia villosa]
MAMTTSSRCSSLSVNLRGTRFNSHAPLPSHRSLIPIFHNNIHPSPVLRTSFHLTAVVPKASAGSYSSTDGDDGVSLGTMKLPVNIDLQRFDSLLFQVDKIAGGARLGFITIGDGDTEVLVYIDCLVFKPNETSAPVFRASRHGLLKDKVPPGEPRIMRSLMQALEKSVQIARL